MNNLYRSLGLGNLLKCRPGASSRRLLACCSGLLVIATAEAQAPNAATPNTAVPQSTQSAAAVSTEQPGLEEIVVTGTLIRNAAPVGSSIIIMDQAKLADTGANDIADMLRDVPQVSSLGVSETSRTGTGGAGNITYGNAIDIRGLGPFATLTLLDGHRVPAAGTTGATVDPDSFPAIMLQRVDIVADGASATYGSDAIAGVANLILRRDVEGVVASVREGWADDYKERQLGIMGGHSWETGQVTIGYENTYHSNLSGEDRGFFESNQTNQGGNNYSSTQCNPGNIVANNGVTYAIPAGGVTPATAGLLVANTLNRCDIGKYGDLIPEVEHNDVALTLDQHFGDSVSLFGDASYSRRTFTVQNTQSTGPLTVPDTNAFYVAPPGAPAATSETVDYFFSDAGDTSQNVGRSENYQVTLGVNVQLTKDWQLSVDGTAGRDHDHAYDPTHALNNGALGAALASSNPATALNVFGGANSPSVINGIFNEEFYAPADSGEQVVEAKLDGPLYHLPGGDLRAAFGGQWRHEELDYGLFDGVPPTGPALILNNDLGRHSTSAFAEFLIPIFGPGNALPGLQSLDLDVTGRHEYYSDFGGTTHPKIGLNWTPVDGVKVHASYGTSFRAPLLSELVGPLKGVFVQGYADPLSPTGTSVGYTLGGGNLNLKPETATTWSFGVDFQPIERLKLGLNFFNIIYRDQISSYLSDLTILQQTAQLGSLITRCPSAECTALINEYVVPGPVFGPVIPNPSVFVNGVELNLGKTTANGFDFDGSYAIPTDSIGQFSVGLTGSLFTQYDVQFTPTGSSFDELNTIGYPLKLRMRGSVGWEFGPVRSIAFINFENSYLNTQVTPNQQVSPYTTVDLNVIYNLGKTLESSSWARDLTFTVHVTNLFDRDPPYVDIPISPNGGGGFDPNNASPVGRLVSVAIGKKF